MGISMIKPINARLCLPILLNNSIFRFLLLNYTLCPVPCTFYFASYSAQALKQVICIFFFATSSLFFLRYSITTYLFQYLFKPFRYQQEDKTLSRARALQKSMLELIDHSNMTDIASGKIIASYAHPFFLSPFYGSR